MGKWEQLKDRLKSPPPERLARVEYQSHFLNIMGVLFVSIVLLFTNMWFLVFAFIFSVGASYSSGMTAYRKYQMIKERMPEENPLDFLEDISPTRKRSKVIEYIYGSYGKWISIIISVILSAVIINPLQSSWVNKLAIIPLVFILFIIIYFFVVYWIAKHFYIKKLKGGIK